MQRDVHPYAVLISKGVVAMMSITLFMKSIIKCERLLEGIEGKAYDDARNRAMRTSVVVALEAVTTVYEGERLAIDMVIAWRIFHLTKLGREIPDVPCTVFFEDAEWKALVAYKTQNPVPPENPPSLREATRMVASLGGFLGRKSDGHPGTKTLWLGLQRLDDLTEMWITCISMFAPNYLRPPPVSSTPTYG